MIILFRLLTVLLTYISAFCISIEPLNFSDFKQTWSNFLYQSNYHLLKQENKEVLEEFEFNLLREFNVQLMPRCRSYLQIIDRYKGCRPYLENKIVLFDGTEMSASFIKVSELGENFSNFIATQAPFVHNIPSFWQMVIENDVNQIIMVTELSEKNHPINELASLYWHDSVNKELSLVNGLKITLIEKDELFSEAIESIQLRKFRVEKEGNQRIVTHYWYRNWMDGQIPNHPEAIMKLVDIVEDMNSYIDSAAPILVHCSAGIGRTGVFIILYYLMQHAKYGYDQKVNLFDLVAFLRWQRPWIVSSLSQYRFCHKMAEIIKNQALKEIWH